MGALLDGFRLINMLEETDPEKKLTAEELQQKYSQKIIQHDVKNQVTRKKIRKVLRQKKKVVAVSDLTGTLDKIPENDVSNLEDAGILNLESEKNDVFFV